MLLLLRFLDGTRTPSQVASAWRQATGERLTTEEVEEVVKDLEEHLVLDGPRVVEARSRAREAYRALTARPPACAGTSYPEDPAACGAFLDAHLASDGGAAVPDRVRALVAPHIDLRGGGPCHGAAARALARCPAETFVVIGTAHAPIERPFALTTRDFDTPRGRVRTDRDLVERLASRAGGGLLDDELAHRREHSVEFQALWLAHLAGRDGRDVAIVPVLAGSIHASIVSGRSPRDDPRVADFVEALREIGRERGERVTIVASVDLAHVGPRYGDAGAVDDAAMATVLEADRGLLRHALASDADGWLRFLHAEGDRRNVCGAAPGWALLAAIEPQGWRGTLLRHDAWEIDPDTGSRVSFCAIAWA
ncbi:MAG TPA: AmmeMemoRadiSam system protein B [Planctomycetota bacterium]|nr:AmmeMemoRadiSam system protein B [Planctomycetota bacterium]